MCHSINFDITNNATQLLGYSIACVGTAMRWKNIIPTIIKQSWNEDRRMLDAVLNEALPELEPENENEVPTVVVR